MSGFSDMGIREANRSHRNYPFSTRAFTSA